jgi:hypothetical protein
LLKQYRESHGGNLPVCMDKWMNQSILSTATAF